MNKRLRYYLIGAFFFLKCGLISSQPHARGVVIDTVKSDIAGQTYSLYLPSTYQDDKQYPVIFFFEPLARGSLPINRYKALAEKYEVILTCSNNSRNYTSPYLSFDAAEAMINDVFSKFSIDKDLVITSGFSGGSRTAIAVATLTTVVKGVIGVGAVGPIFPENDLKRHHKIPYAGLVGNRDFNFTEHYHGEKLFLKEGITNVRFVFKGPHQWAPVNDYEIALAWMLSKLQPGSTQKLLKEELVADYINTLEDSVSIVDADRIREYFRSDFELALSEPSYEPSALAKEEKKLAKMIDMEEKLRKQYRDSLFMAYRLPPNRNANGPLNWIIDTGLSYKRRVTQNERRNAMRAEMYDRLVNFIQASTYEHSTEAMLSKNFNRAYIGVEVWSTMIDNERWEYWRKCKLHAMNGDVPTATRYLEKLIKIGFENGRALKADSTFNVLSGTKQYIQLTESME